MQNILELLKQKKWIDQKNEIGVQYNRQIQAVILAAEWSA